MVCAGLVCKLCGGQQRFYPDDEEADNHVQDLPKIAALVPVFECACGRRQTYAREGTPGGVTIDEAEAVGWAFRAGAWWCPICMATSPIRTR